MKPSMVLGSGGADDEVLKPPSDAELVGVADTSCATEREYSDDDAEGARPRRFRRAATRLKPVLSRTTEVAVAAIDTVRRRCSKSWWRLLGEVAKWLGLGGSSILTGQPGV
jgi:hypothetical protein